MDRRFEAVVARREWNSEILWPVFEKCVDNPQELRGDEYHIGMSLFEAGLMEIKQTPIWNSNQSHIGNRVVFKSLTL